MKQFIVISIYFVLICFLFFVINKRLNREYFENDRKNISVDIGNRLCLNFTHMLQSFLKKEDYHPEKTDISFFKDFPTIQYDSSIHNKLIEKNIDLSYLDFFTKDISLWSIEEKKREEIWDIIHPIVHNTLNEMFQKNGIVKEVKYPVIHFRCSDVPFIKHFHYHLQKYSYFKDSLEEIQKEKNMKYDTVILVSCSFHNAGKDNQEKCNIYIDSLKSYLESIGYKVIVQCDTNIDDFATIFYAPAVISTGGSFSFMSGYFGNGIFISEGHYQEEKEDTKCKTCKSWLKSGYSIDHKDVKDYYDTTSVIEKLQK